jgi:hypothetical protein
MEGRVLDPRGLDEPRLQTLLAVPRHALPPLLDFVAWSLGCVLMDDGEDDVRATLNDPEVRLAVYLEGGHVHALEGAVVNHYAKPPLRPPEAALVFWGLSNDRLQVDEAARLRSDLLVHTEERRDRTKILRGGSRRGRVVDPEGLLAVVVAMVVVRRPAVEEDDAPVVDVDLRRPDGGRSRERAAALGAGAGALPVHPFLLALRDRWNLPV